MAEAQAQGDKVKGSVPAATVHRTCAKCSTHANYLNPQNNLSLQRVKVRPEDVKCVVGPLDCLGKAVLASVRKMLVWGLRPPPEKRSEVFLSVWGGGVGLRREKTWVYLLCTLLGPQGKGTLRNR